MASSNSTDRDDIALSTSELDDVLSSADISSEPGNADESGLEKYGIWIKVEPETLEPLAEAETSFEMADLEGEPEAGPDKLTAEEEQLLGELESEIETPAAEPTDFEGLEKDLQELGRASSDRLAEEDEDLTVADLDLDLDELALDRAEEAPATETAEVEVSLSDGVPELDSLEQAAESAGFSAAAAGGGRPSSDHILRKIEEDLKQIKSEIQNLKKELAGLGRAGAAAEAEVPHTPAAPGFFAEEEDDSIALTGDELDNILNTADITEEKAAGAGPLEELAEPAPELLESLEPPALDLMEPGSLTPEPEEIEIEFDEKPAGDLELLEGSVDDLGPDLEPEPMLEEQPPAEAEELVLEDLSGGDAPELAAEELTLAEEEAPQEADELTLQDFSGEDGLETLAEAAPEAEELTALLEDNDLPSVEALPEVEAEPVELELMEELGAPEPAGPEAVPHTTKPGRQTFPEDLREDMKSVLSYLDQLLEALPKEKIEQFAQSEHFQVYTKLFKELGLEG